MERLSGIKEVARVSGYAALEGAAIGSLMLGPLPGFFAGGIVGGVTALVAEGVGRGIKVDIKGAYDVQTTITDQGTLVYSKKTQAELPKRRMPWIKVPDFFLQLAAKNSPQLQTKLTFTNDTKPDRSSRTTWTITSPNPIE